jgi:hypothetical protein
MRGVDDTLLELDAAAHRANGALHYVLLMLDAEITGRMKSGDLAGAQRLQAIVRATRKRAEGTP